MSVETSQRITLSPGINPCNTTGQPRPVVFDPERDIAAVIVTLDKMGILGDGDGNLVLTVSEVFHSRQ